MSEHPITGMTALVTGASRGFGRGIATALTRAGAQVVGVARDREYLHRVLRADLGRRALERYLDHMEALIRTTRER